VSDLRPEIAPARAVTETIRWKVGKVIDAHVHFRGVEPVPHFYRILDIVGYDKVCILGGTAEGGPALERKADQSARFYAFGRLQHDRDKARRGDGAYLVGQVEQMRALGYDGLKMLEGKPSLRGGTATAQDWAPWTLDHRYYAPLWEALEALDRPVTLHVADPVDWWNSADPAVAIYRTEAPQESFFQEAIAVLERHPRLRINFAHFLFMGPQLDRMGDLLSRFPGMRVDMAMGDEFLYYLSDDPERARDFFIRWQDRILYGTDISDRNSLRHAWAKAATLRRFLETGDAFVNPTQEALGQPPQRGSNGRLELRGLDLPPEVLGRVLALNFEAFAGANPMLLPRSPGCSEAE